MTKGSRQNPRLYRLARHAGDLMRSGFVTSERKRNGETCARALQAHKATLQRKVAERKADLTAKQVQRAAAEAESAELAARVAAQTYSKEDVKRMTADK